MRSKYAATLVLMLGAALAAGTAWAGNATAKEAEAMVKKGVGFIKANGTQKGYSAITGQDPQFKDRDLYLVVYRMDGTPLAHGANAKMVGRNLIELKDIDGKEFVRERIELAKKNATFWQDYKFTNPVTRKVEPKTAYCERVEDTVICGGIYK